MPRTARSEMVCDVATRSAVFMPATGSSNSRSLGSMHRARASSTRLRIPYGRDSTGRVEPPRPTNSAISRARSRCRACSDTAHGSRSRSPRTGAGQPMPAQHQVVGHRLPGSGRCSGRSAPRPGRHPVRPQRGQLGVAEPGPRPPRPGRRQNDVEEARLARTVGPDQAWIWPGATSKLTSSRATSPANRTVTSVDHQWRYGRRHPAHLVRPAGGGPGTTRIGSPVPRPRTSPR